MEHACAREFRAKAPSLSQSGKASHTSMDHSDDSIVEVSSNSIAQRQIEINIVFFELFLGICVSDLNNL